MLFNKKKRKRKVGLVRRLFIRRPPEEAYTTRFFMGECPNCGSEDTVAVEASCGIPSSDYLFMNRRAKKGLPVSIVPVEEYRELRQFGVNAVCRTCKKYFKGEKARLDIPKEGSCVEAEADGGESRWNL